ncbi:hypothetical protein ANCDUO_06393 [Ancylostoma duodenale]|uniref:Uncharacterized protein n=1 Tax=Ancylostoma duodenale TaxID=51022 RepID=A0A0C2GPP9_9BILA|nr:hypothetical protein ANCDUO_06393 [Ancylostoma duodenale]
MALTAVVMISWCMPSKCLDNEKEGYPGEQENILHLAWQYGRGLREAWFVKMVASKRVKCPPGTLSEGQIVSALFSNYTKMLPEGDSAVEVQIEMHIQVGAAVPTRLSHAQTPAVQ